MVMFYSPSKHGFYSVEIHGENIPIDSVQITDEHYSSLLIAQSEGRSIVTDINGFPTTQAAVVPTNLDLYKSAASILNNEYQKDVDGYMLAFNNAALADGASQVTKQTAIRSMYQQRKTLYASDLANLKIQYGV